MLGYQGGDSRLIEEWSPPVSAHRSSGPSGLGHPLVNGLRMARLEDDADVSGAVVRERR